MKKLLFLPLLLLTGGCLVAVSDPAADRAAAAYCELQQDLPDSPQNIAMVAARVPADKYVEIRSAFARMLAAQQERTPRNIQLAEEARISLNLLQGFLPGDPVQYDLAGAVMDCPDELPPISTAEKAALILDDGATAIPELLGKVRYAHLTAIVAMNQKNLEPAAANRCEYFIATLRLAQIIGVEPEKLDQLHEYEKRFDSALVRWRKAHESGK